MTKSIELKMWKLKRKAWMKRLKSHCEDGFTTTIVEEMLIAHQKNRPAEECEEQEVKVTLPKNLHVIEITEEMILRGKRALYADPFLENTERFSASFKHILGEVFQDNDTYVIVFK